MTVQRFKLFLICLITFYSSQQLTIGDVNHISPIDPYVAVGETLLLNCSIESLPSSNHSLNASHLSFVLQRNVPFPPRVLLSSLFNYVFEPFVMQLQYPNVTKNDSGFYRCWLNRSSLGVPADLDLGASEVEIGSPPLPITNITAVSDNFENMTVVWSSEPGDWIKYDFKYTKSTIPPQSGNCSSWSTEAYSYSTRCVFCALSPSDPCTSDTAKDFSRFLSYTVYIIAANNYGSSDGSLSFTADETIVKPRPVQDLRSLSINSTSLYISWKYPQDLPPSLMSLFYQCLYRNAWNNITLVQNVDNETAIYLLGLVPNTLYTITVRSHPVGGCIWSDDVSIEITTDEDVPGVAPVIPVGWYRSAGCETDMDNYCSFTFFWMPIDKELQHGVIREYRLISTDGSASSAADSFSGVLQLKNDEAQSIGLQAVTSAGGSPINYIYFAPNKQTMTDLYAESNPNSTGIFFSWSSSSPADNYTLIYCLGNQRQADKCMGAPLLITLPGNETSYSLTVGDYTSYVYSIAMNRADGSSGLTSTWMCLYTFAGLPAAPQFNSVQQTKEHSLTVSWNALECSDDNRARVIQYRLSWMEFNSENVSVVNIASNVTQFEIINLETLTVYTVTLQGVSRDGAGSRSSVNMTTVEPIVQWNYAWIAAIIVPAVCAVVVFIIVACINRYRQQKSQPILAITVPDYEAPDTFKDIQGQLFDANGYEKVVHSYTTKDSSSSYSSSNSSATDPAAAAAAETDESIQSYIQATVTATDLDTDSMEHHSTRVQLGTVAVLSHCIQEDTTPCLSLGRDDDIITNVQSSRCPESYQRTAFIVSLADTAVRCSSLRDKMSNNTSKPPDNRSDRQYHKVTATDDNEFASSRSDNISAVNESQPQRCRPIEEADETCVTKYRHVALDENMTKDGDMGNESSHDSSAGYSHVFFSENSDRYDSILQTSNSNIDLIPPNVEPMQSSTDPTRSAIDSVLVTSVSSLSAVTVETTGCLDICDSDIVQAAGEKGPKIEKQAVTFL